MFSFFVRLILFIIAISLIRAAIRFVLRAWKSFQDPRSSVASGVASKDNPVRVLLQQDPVCGTYVAVDSSLKQITGGRVVHFCSAECRDRYRA